ncbi:MAG: hypothetical protein U0324_14200 [Polyangiales bacterium]
MTVSDRAFHALAQAEPEVVMAALRALIPRLAAGAVPLRPADLSPTRLDALAPPKDADWIARVGETQLVHLECQGYQEAAFLLRLFRYHLTLALLHPERTVTTVALWLIAPSRAQRRKRFTHRKITVELEHLVLGEVDARVLLANPMTACFAAGARAVEMSDEALCARVAAALVENNASWYQRHMAVITAATQRRLQALTEAMARADAPPVIIEDTFFLAMDEGEKIGIEKGKQIGIETGEKIGATKAAAEALLRVLTARGLAVTEAERARVLACADLATLEGWITRAVTLPTVAEVLRETPVTERATSPRKHARRPRP